MAELPINRSAKTVISGNLTTSRHNHLFIFLFFYFLFLFFTFIFYFIFYIFAENRHYRLICIEIATDVIGWPEWIKKYLFVIQETKCSSSCLLWQTLSKSTWCLLKHYMYMHLLHVHIHILMYVFEIDIKWILICLGF